MGQQYNKNSAGSETTRELLDRLDALLRQLDMPMEVPALKKEDVISAMFMDKKFSGQVLRAIVLNEIGKCFIHPTDVGFFDSMMI